MSALLLSNLGVVCPSCDFLNVVGAATCMACNAAITDAAPAKALPKTQTPPPAEAPAAKRPAEEPAPMPRAATPPPLSKAAAAPAKPSQPFPSTQTPPPQGQPVAGPKFGLSVLAGPARGQRFRLGNNGAQLGRSKGVILFPTIRSFRRCMQPSASKTASSSVRDDNSTSGIYVSIARPRDARAPTATSAPACVCSATSGALEPAPPWNRLGMLTVYGAPVPANTTFTTRSKKCCSAIAPAAHGDAGLCSPSVRAAATSRSPTTKDVSAAALRNFAAPATR